MDRYQSIDPEAALALARFDHFFQILRTHHVVDLVQDFLVIAEFFEYQTYSHRLRCKAIVEQNFKALGPRQSSNNLEHLILLESID